MNSTIRTVIVSATLALTAGLISCGTTDVRTSVHEESPAFNCYTDGNRLCGPTDATSGDGWRVWNESDGPRHLRMDPSRPFRVDFIGTATQYPEIRPYDLALPAKDGKWYVFRAEYTK